MKKQFFLILILALILVRCKKYEATYGTETASTAVFNAEVYETAYSTENGVFLINAAMTRSKMLVSFANNSSPKAGHVALSPKRDKVAYIDPDSGVPIIVDTLGNVLAQLSQYPNTKDLGWYNGDTTLYILSNNQIHFYGQALDLPSPLFVVPPFSVDYEVTAVDINKDLDVAYTAVYYRLSSASTYRNWFYRYDINYKSPSLTDESEVTAGASYSHTQNIATDSRNYYHTIQFLEFGYLYPAEKKIVTATAERTQFATAFKGHYTFIENNLEFSVGEDGNLFRNIYYYHIIESPTPYTSTSWDIMISNSAPLYVDWVTSF